MTIRISEELDRILNFAREEAMRTGSFGIGTDHIVLGMIRHGDNAACDALRGLDADLQEMKRHIDSRIFTNEHIPYSEMERIRFSREAHNLVNLTLLEAIRLGSEAAQPEHLLLALFRVDGSYSQNYLRDMGIDYGRVFRYLEGSGALKRKEPAMEQRPDGDEPEAKEDEKAPSALEEFGFDMTEAAREGKFDPVVGRDAEIERVIQILGRRKKNNPMLVGEPGVGKSAIVEGIAMRIASGNIPPAISGKKIISLDIASVVAGTRYRGDFEKRIKQIISEVSSDPDTILFVDEFHTMVGAGGASGSLDAAGMLKPSLARGEIQCIGATTSEEFRKIVEKDAALDRRFQKVAVEPADVQYSIDILKSIKVNYEQHHGVSYSDEALEACAKLSERYISDRCLPDKAIDAMDEAGSMVRLRRMRKPGSSETVSAEDVASVISQISGIPVSRVASAEGNKLMQLDKTLKKRVIGQDEAVDVVVKAVRRGRAGIHSPGRPVGTFLFLGPTGVGKTHLAQSIAECLFDSPDNLIRIDMSEFSEKFTVSRLVGAPPGYVGFEEGGQLVREVRRKPYSVILLDEIEKAHPDIFNILLQILDEGRLTGNDSRTVSFRNTIIIMTSNVGSRELEDYGNGMGFATSGRNSPSDRKAVVEKAVRKVFPPEFLNRIDEQVYFNSLDQDSLSTIIGIEIEDLKKRMLEVGFRLSVSAAAKKFVAEKGYNPGYGARPLKRAIRKWIEDPVSEYIISAEGSNAPRGLVLKIVLSKDGRETVVKA